MTAERGSWIVSRTMPGERRLLAERVLSSLAVLWAVAAPLSATGAQDSTISGQDVTVRAEVDRSEITVGDRVVLAITVEHGPDDQITWPTTADAFGEFEVLDARLLEPVAGGGAVTSRAEFVVTTFELDEVEIPSVEVVVLRDGGAVTITTVTDPVRITVSSVGRDEGDSIRDIKPPLGIPRNWWLVVPWVMAVAALGALFYWLYRRYRRRANAQPSIPTSVTPARPPHELAYEALDRLEAGAMWERGEIKRFFSEASDILRVYLEGRFGIIAMEMTSRDIVDALGALRLPPGTLDDFDGLLRRCDLVKFAKLRPDPDTCRAVIPMARSLVDRTREPSTGGPSEMAEGVTPDIAATVAAADVTE